MALARDNALMFLTVENYKVPLFVIFIVINISWLTNVNNMLNSPKKTRLDARQILARIFILCCSDHYSISSALSEDCIYKLGAH